MSPRSLRSLAFMTCLFVLAACGSGGGGGGGGSGSLVAPALATQPASQTVRDAQSASFTVASNGSAPLNYQWQRGGTGGVVTTLAGSAGSTGTADGTGNAARFNNPVGLVVDAANNVYVADSNNGTIRKITPAGVVTTVAGVADGRTGVQTGALPGRLGVPFLLAIDAAGNLYVTSANGVLRISL